MDGRQHSTTLSATSHHRVFAWFRKAQRAGSSSGEWSQNTLGAKKGSHKENDSMTELRTAVDTQDGRDRRYSAPNFRITATVFAIALMGYDGA
jgi:hypothetical protein